MSQQIQRWTLVATILGSSMVFINVSAINVALPALQTALDASVADIQWILNAYTLFLAALLLLGGVLGDHFGRKRVFLIGVVLFTLASILCALANNTTQLIIARALQGVGGALLTPGSLAILSATFPETERGRAIGLWSSFSALTSAVGPILGGWLIDQFAWQWIFLIHLPLAVAVLIISVRWLPAQAPDASAERPPLDWLGALLAVCGPGLLTWGLIASGNDGWTTPHVLISCSIGLLLIILFIVVERRVNNPMMPLSLFKSATFSNTNLLTFFLYTALYAVFFFLPLNLIQIQGFTATQAGAALLPMILLLALLSQRMGALASRIGPRPLLIGGPLVAGLGFALMARPGINANYWLDFFPAVTVLGLGMAITVAPLTTAVMTSVSDDKAGTASGINNAVTRFSSLLSVALFGIIMLALFSQALERELAASTLSADLQNHILAARSQLASIELPSDLSADAIHTATLAIKNSFLYGFRAISLISGALAWLSALIAFIGIKA